MYICLSYASPDPSRVKYAIIAGITIPELGPLSLHASANIEQIFLPDITIA
jgi:hypothetical protein